MHLTLIFIVIISYSTAYSHPLLEQPQQKQNNQQLLESRQQDELDSSTARPLQQFFKKILSAFRTKSQTTTPRAPALTTRRISVPYHQQPLEMEQIPNFVDYSTYLLDSFSSNSAIQFSYIQPNGSALRGGNYSVISFLVPHEMPTAPSNRVKGILNFFNLFRFPWSRDPTVPNDTVYTQFPPLFEYFTQRIQAYFSVYKFSDESRLNNTIVFELPDNAPQHDDGDFIATTTDDFIETTTDYQMATTDEMEANELLLTTTEMSNEM